MSQKRKQDEVPGPYIGFAKEFALGKVVTI